jgi:hypothetical protein
MNGGLLYYPLENLLPSAPWLLLAADFARTDVPVPWLGNGHLRLPFG